MSYRKDLQRMAKSMGWTVEQRRSGHFRLTKVGRPFVTASYSPKDPTQVLRNVRRDLERADAAVTV